MVPKCYITFTTCSQLICPERPIPFHIPPPLQLKKKHLAVTSSLLSPIIRTPSPLLVPSLPSSAYFRYAISFLSFSCVSLALAHCTLLKCIFSNYSSKANCLPREPKPCPVLQEITEHNKIAHHLFLAVCFLCIVSETLCSSATTKKEKS